MSRARSLLTLVALAVALVGCSGGSERGFVGSAGTVPTSAPPTTTTGVTVGGVTNTTAPAPPTTRPPRGTTTTAPPPPVDCSSLLLAVEATTDKATYRRGEVVRINAVLRNKSDVPCRYSSYGLSTRIDDAAGVPVRPAPIITIDTLEENILLPGQTLGSTPNWDQQICSGAAPCTPAPAGAYKARPIWVFAGAPVEGAVTFELAP
jgi:hypothetical protein